MSTLARACPHCGAPPRSAAAVRWVLLATLVAGLLAMGIALALREDGVGSTPADVAWPLAVMIIVLAGLVVVTLVKRRG